MRDRRRYKASVWGSRRLARFRTLASGPGAVYKVEVLSSPLLGSISAGRRWRSDHESVTLPGKEGGQFEPIRSLSELLAELRRIRDVMETVPLDPFFEPQSALELKKGIATLLSIDAATLLSWSAHVSYSAIVKMRALEDPLVELLTNRHILSAGVLARSYMETASLPPYSLERLNACAKSGTWEDMRTLVPEALFGTSLKLAPRESIWEDVLDFSDTKPVRIRNAIDAMDSFAECRSSPVKRYFRAAYALLCEFAHPNLRATRSFVDVMEDRLGGWLIRYKANEQATEEDASNVLQIVLDSTRVGYASALLLLDGRFEDSSEGIIYHWPTSAKGDWIWRNILQGRRP